MQSLQLSSPQVSVIIPFFNRERFLLQSIESILSQSFEDWELLLVDDGSTDSSSSIAAAYVDKYPTKIFLFSHEGKQNLGASKSRNLGITNARGKYITFLDSDDIFYPTALEQELAAFAKSPEADVVCGTLDLWHSWEENKTNSDVDFTINLGLELEKLYEPPALLIHNLIAGGRKPGINSIMMKRDFIDLIKAFEGDFRHVSEDQVFWSKVSLNGKIYVMDACLARYRQHTDSSCSVLIQNGNETQNWEVFLDWLENYLKEKEIEDAKVWNAVKSCRKDIRLQHTFRKFKKVYRQIFPLHLRYRLRDKIIVWRLKKTKWFGK